MAFYGFAGYVCDRAGWRRIGGLEEHIPRPALGPNPIARAIASNSVDFPLPSHRQETHVGMKGQRVKRPYGGDVEWIRIGPSDPLALQSEFTQVGLSLWLMMSEFSRLRVNTGRLRGLAPIEQNVPPRRSLARPVGPQPCSEDVAEKYFLGKAVIYGALVLLASCAFNDAAPPLSAAHLDAPSRGVSRAAITEANIYVANFYNSTVTVYDRKNYALIRTISQGVLAPDALALTAWGPLRRQ